jgi:hypothetical protein
MSANFDKAVAMVRSLPADGPTKPSQDQQLAVSSRDEPSDACWVQDIRQARQALFPHHTPRRFIWTVY